MSTPAATPEPITPATFGPIACINRKLVGFSAAPTFWDTRAAIGTAETPAEPISGFTLPLVKTYISFPNRTPPAVPTQNANRPKKMIAIVCGFRNFSALAVAPTVTPKKMVTMFISSFCAVLTRRSTTPLSLNRFPSISIPIDQRVKVKLIEGSYDNIKVTTPEDVRIAGSLVKARKLFRFLHNVHDKIIYLQMKILQKRFFTKKKK